VKGEDCKKFSVLFIVQDLRNPPLAPHSHLRPNLGELDYSPLSLGGLQDALCVSLVVVT
jgi:hypothetical protein